MTGRFAKILLSILCGALILIAGCTSPAPSTGGAAPTPAAGGASTGQAGAAATDLTAFSSQLQAMNDKLGLIAENTAPQGRALETGNIILFDNSGNLANSISLGTSLITLPQGTCDIAIYADGTPIFTTVEELKSYLTSIYSRNKQSCIDVVVCRNTVTLDSDFSYLYITYKPYNENQRLSLVTLAYRCKSY